MAPAAICVGCGKLHSPDMPCADGTQWAVFKMQCRICSHHQVSVIPLIPGGEEPANTECGNCGNMACDVEDNDEEETEI